MAKIDLLLLELKYPENIGLIYRLAFQFNVQNIYLYKCKKPGNTNTYKTEKHIPIHKIETLDFLKTYPYPKFLLETNGEILEKIQSPNFLLAVGNESYGTTLEQQKIFDKIYSLNAPNQISYNVSHALAISLYHIVY